jgi:hypothetical protein
MQGSSSAVFSENNLKFGMCRNSSAIPFLTKSSVSFYSRMAARAQISGRLRFTSPPPILSPSFTSLALPQPPHPRPTLSSYPRWHRSALQCCMLTISATSRCDAGAPYQPPPVVLQEHHLNHLLRLRTKRASRSPRLVTHHYQPCWPPVAGKWSSVAPSLNDARVGLCAPLRCTI